MKSFLQIEKSQFRFHFSSRCPLSFQLLVSFFLFLGLFLSPGRQIVAQVIQSPYRQFSIKDGLPQQQVMCLYQDSRGYLWMGTKWGVSKFDGEHFENFSRYNSLTGNEIKKILEDAEGNIWILGTSGIAYYDGVEIKRVLAGKNLDISILGPKVCAFDIKIKVFYQLSINGISKSDTLILEGLENLALNHSMEDGMWFNYWDHASLFYVKIGQSGKILAVRKAPQTSTHILNNQLLDNLIFLDPDQSGKFSLWDLNTGRDHLKFRIEGPSEQKGLCYTKSIKGDYFLISSYQIYSMVKGDSVFRPVQLPALHPNALCLDDEGSLWVGTEAGLIQYFPDGFRYLDDKDAPLTWQFLEDADGNFWIGSYNLGMRKFDGNKIEKVDLKVKNYQGELVTPNLYFGASRDHLGNLYFSSDLGLIKYEKGKFRNLHHPQSVDECLGSLVMYHFFDTVSKKVIIAQRSGVSYYDPEEDRLGALYSGDCDQCYVLGLTRDRFDNYWFSSGGWLIQYHIPDKTTVHYSKKNGNLPFRGAYCLEVDHRGNIWVGTTDGGLYVYDHSLRTFNKVLEDVIDRQVFNLKLIDSSSMMVGAADGLYMISLHSYYQNGKAICKAYNFRNGFLALEPNQNGSLIDSKGNYWVLSSNQIACIHKDKLNHEFKPSKVRITSMNAIRIPFAHQGAISIPYGVNEILCRFESIGFQRSFRAQYSWRILGFTEWSEWSEDRFCFASHLSSGNYVLEVRSRHPGVGVNDLNQTSSLLFSVKLPFFQEPYFYKNAFFAGLVTIILGISGVIFLWRSKRRTGKAILLAEERARMVKYYQIQTLQSQLNPNFVFNLLQTIINRIRKDDKRAAEENIVNLGKLLRRFLDSNVESNISSNGSISNQISISQEVELLQMYLSLEKLQLRDSFDYSINVAPDINPESTFIIPMIIQPFVENSIKHGISYKGTFGKIWVSFFRLNGKICCKIEDDGVGREQAKRIQEKSEYIYKSRGQSLVKERAKLLNELGYPVRIVIEDRPGGGTLVTIEFPEI